MGRISDRFIRSPGTQEWTVPLLRHEDYTLEEWHEYYREKPEPILWMRDKHPDAFEVFVEMYGQEFADEIILLASEKQG